MKRKLYTLAAMLLLTATTLCAQRLRSESPKAKLQWAEMAITNLYVDTVDENKLVEDAIRGMLEKLDPHSTYSTAKEVKALNESLEGNFEGIGVQFNMMEDTLVVIQTIAGGPSERGGIIAGDRIVIVNDTAIAGVKMSKEDIMRRLRGPKGTKVVLKVKRQGFKELLPFTIVRDVIPVHSLDASYVIRPGIGYIRIGNFGATTYNEFSEALDKLTEQGITRLIIDLQDNGGGYLQSAATIINDFLERGDMIVYTEGRSNPRMEYRADGRKRFSGEVVGAVTSQWVSGSSTSMSTKNRAASFIVG